MQIRTIILWTALLMAGHSDAQLSSKKVDGFGNLNNDNASARLDNYAIQLQMDPEATGYIITYGGNKKNASTAKARAEFAKNYLVNTRGMDAGWIIALEGGVKTEPGTELWIVPPGAMAPSPSPALIATPVKTKIKSKRKS